MYVYGMSIRLNKALRLLNISLHESTSILKDRSDLGEFRDKLSWKITFEQFNLLVEYAKITGKHYDEVLVNEFLKKHNNDISQKTISPKLKIAGHTDLEKNNQQTHHISIKPDKNNINTQTGIHNDVQIGIKERKQKKFRHKKPKIVVIKKNGIKILDVNTSHFIYKENAIIYKYGANTLSFHANGISPILNNHVHKIKEIYPIARIKVGVRKFRFTNPKFYNFITDLAEDIQDKAKKKEKSIQFLTRGIENIYKIPKVIINQNKEQLLQADNLEFFDYYYKIWVIDSNKIKCRDIDPFVIQDENSRACLNVLNKYFANRLPHDIFVQYSNGRVIAVDKIPILSTYIKILKENILIRGDWEYELCNYRKRTLDDCKKIPQKNVYKDASYKSIYIDYLASNQSDKQLIKAYEVFNGLEEDSFIFAIKMKDDLFAIIFENVLFARASEVFVVRENEYEKCVNLIFNYFTDYELKQKRLAIKRKLIKAEDFNAIKYVSIDHDKFPTWINNIQNVISEVKVQQEHIQFVHGLRISKNESLRNVHTTTNVSHIHKDLMLKLFFKLARKYGKENVGTEICVGKKRIDMAVRIDKKYDIYEIKSDYDVRTCIRQAIGQVFDYAYYGCSDDIGKMVIVGPSPITDEADKYLASMRNQHKINIYYETV